MFFNILPLLLFFREISRLKSVIERNEVKLFVKKLIICKK